MICLYSCGGEGVVYQHHATSLNEEAVCIDTIIRSTNTLQHMLPLRSEVSWRSDRSFVAIGNDDGSIEILGAPHLLLLCTIQVHHKIINCLQWFPSQIPQGQSSLWFCLASGSNETVVHVHDLSNVLGQETLIPMPAPISSAFRSLNGHMLRVTTLQWNPLADGKLASVSYDGTAQIWDVDSGEALANFRGHQGRLLSVAWSHLDPDILFTGGEDFCVMKWKISECTHKQPPKAFIDAILDELFPVLRLDKDSNRVLAARLAIILEQQPRIKMGSKNP
ncbi:putative gem-associated protein 5-like [Apostichopus japonicus]|uniref:Putative gem-associated protein 5-like n=1 Tax=Stichopus japonicus TaxID=307972 RepID=A0A2G8LKJ9_STIJA|nr:putative gem-associated protein 5-like [Apostichopus japonicus]